MRNLLYSIVIVGFLGIAALIIWEVVDPREGGWETINAISAAFAVLVGCVAALANLNAAAAARESVEISSKSLDRETEVNATIGVSVDDTGRKKGEGNNPIYGLKIDVINLGKIPFIVTSIEINFGDGDVDFKQGVFAVPVNGIGSTTLSVPFINRLKSGSESVSIEIKTNPSTKEPLIFCEKHTKFSEQAGQVIYLHQMHQGFGRRG